MPKPKFQAPLRPTPKVVGRGTVSHPTAPPKAKFQAPLLPTPKR